MKVLVQSQVQPGSVSAPLVKPRQARPGKVVTPLLAPQVAETASATAASSPLSRWFLLLGIPFVLGAAFFGLALGLGDEWPMIPAFLFGPFLLVAAYIYLSLTSDTNSDR